MRSCMRETCPAYVCDPLDELADPPWYAEERTYRGLVVSCFKLVIIAPYFQGSAVRYRDSTLVDFAQSVHFLHVLPIGSTKSTRTTFEHFKIIEPELSCIDINTNLP